MYKYIKKMGIVAASVLIGGFLTVSASAGTIHGYHFAKNNTLLNGIAGKQLAYYHRGRGHYYHRNRNNGAAIPFMFMRLMMGPGFGYPGYGYGGYGYGYGGYGYGYRRHCYYNCVRWNGNPAYCRSRCGW